jgi:predicted neutral ceramidase superfamily lipid hydrolase
MGLFGIMRNWKPVRLICLTEGLVFVPLAIFLAGHLGIFGILIASLVAHLGVTTAMSAKAASPVIGSWRQQRSGYLVSITLVVASALIAWLGNKLNTPPVIMLAVTAIAVLVSMGVVWHGILSPQIRARILSIPVISKLKLGSA